MHGKFILLAASILLLLIGLTRAAVGPYFELLCSEPTQPRTISKCALDCIRNHGATGGHCGDFVPDANCYCEGYSLAGSPQTSNHCLVQNDEMRNACTADCLCNHGALGGLCDFKRRACICVGQRENPNSENCPGAVDIVPYKPGNIFKREIDNSSYYD